MNSTIELIHALAGAVKIQQEIVYHSGRIICAAIEEIGDDESDEHLSKTEAHFEMLNNLQKSLDRHYEDNGILDKIDPDKMSKTKQNLFIPVEEKD